MASFAKRATDFKDFRYDPSLAAAIIFIIVFTLTSTFHMYQMVSTRTWYLIPMVIGGFFEILGYIARAILAEQSPNWTTGPFIIETLFPLLAPALFAASIYMILGRIILLVDGESSSIIKKRWLTKTFVTGDVLCFLLQAGGGGIMAGKGADAMSNGSHIIVSGVIVQMLFFGFFLVVASVFHRRICAQPTSKSTSILPIWQKHVLILYVTSVLILVRSVYRMIEYAQGNNGSVSQHEWPQYIFDAVLMLAVLVIYNFVHPSEIKALLKGGKWSYGLKMHNGASYRDARSNEYGRMTAQESV